MKESVGYSFFISERALAASLPPDVANKYISLPERSFVSMKDWMTLGAVYHQIGKPMYTCHSPRD